MTFRIRKQAIKTEARGDLGIFFVPAPRESEIAMLSNHDSDFLGSFRDDFEKASSKVENAEEETKKNPQVASMSSNEQSLAQPSVERK